MRFFQLPPLLAVWLCVSFAALRGDSTFYSGRTEYILVTTPKTWAQAQADALAKGGNLVRVDSAVENAVILSKVSGKVTATASDGGGAVYVWIGGKETATEGTFAWESGAASFWGGGKTGAAVDSLYSNWGRTAQGASGPEPDNLGGTQNTVGIALGRWPSTAATDELAIGTAGQWNDLNETNLLPYVIERPITKPAEGIFATFTMTHGGRPMGSFTCELFYDKAPKAVANFISLAEGTRTWIHPQQGLTRNQFYNGLKCHRIISDFMIQGGDHTGTGSGEIGYRFIDEFHPDLRHDHLGMLSMANSGLSTNGTQFFVTAANTQHLDDVHTIFGHVVSGYEQVVVPLNLVAKVPTGNPLVQPSVPVEEVRIQTVTIERVGAAAQAFDPFAQKLPECEWQPVKFEIDTAQKHYLKWNDPANVTYQLFNSKDLKTWSGEAFTYYTGLVGGDAQSLETTAVPKSTDSTHFFRLSRTRFHNPFAPTAPILKKFTLTGSKRGIKTTFVLNTATGGTHNIVWAARSIDLNSTLSNVTWEMSHFDSCTLTSDITAPLVVNFPPVYTFTHSDWILRFTPGSALTKGTFTGGFYVANRSEYLDENGTFTVTTP